jgi:hypothetical protein
MKLVTLGCSLTSGRDYFSRSLSKILKLDLLDLAVSGGSNPIQIHNLQGHLIDGDINSDDLIYWQVTSMFRKHDRLSLIKYAKEVADAQQHVEWVHYHESKKNVFDNIPRFELLCFSPMLKDITYELPKVYDDLQELLATMILLKAKCPKMIVTFGWEKVLHCTGGELNRFKGLLTQHSIDYIDTCYLEYSVHNKLEFSDATHPAESAGKQYIQEIVYPKLLDLGMINPDK